MQINQSIEQLMGIEYPEPPDRTPSRAVAKGFTQYRFTPLGYYNNATEILTLLRNKVRFEYCYLWLEHRIAHSPENIGQVGIRLNHRYGYINPSSAAIRIGINLDVSQKDVTYFLKVNYDDSISNTSSDRFAVEIQTKLFSSLVAMAKFIGVSLGNVKSADTPLSIINQQFQKAFKTTDPATLDFLYRKSPTEVLLERTEQQLWADLKSLAAYDAGSWFKDTSRAMVKLMAALYLQANAYNLFKNNPATTLQIYNLINSYDNKKEFCTYLTALSLAFAPEEEAKPTIKKSKIYEVICQESKEKPGLIYIKNTNLRYNRPLFGNWLNPCSNLTYNYIAKEEDENTNNADINALYLLYMVQRSTFENNMKVLRGAADLLVLMLALIPQTALAGRVLRILDIGLSATDLAYLALTQGDKEYLMQVEGEAQEPANWFLQNWDTIYAMIGAGLLTASLAQGILKFGPRLVSKAPSAISGKIKKLIELAKKVPQQAAKSVAPVAKTIFQEIGILKSIEQNLTKELGLSIARSKTGDTIEVIYKGEKVFEGEQKVVKEWLEDLHYKPNDKTQKWLQLIVEERELLRKIDKAIEKLGIEIKLPKNILNVIESEKRLKKIYDTLKNMSKSNKFKPGKNALMENGYKVPLSKNGVSADYRDTEYLFQVSGTEKNIVKIRLTGDRETDKLLCWELSGINPTQEIKDRFVWHHMNDFDPINGTCEMQLVLDLVHTASKPHYGATSLVDYFYQKAIYSSKLSLKI